MKQCQMHFVLRFDFLIEIDCLTQVHTLCWWDGPFSISLIKDAKYVQLNTKKWAIFFEYANILEPSAAMNLEMHQFR